MTLTQTLTLTFPGQEGYDEVGPGAVCAIGGLAGVVTWTVSYPQADAQL